MAIVLPAVGEDRLLARALGKVVPTDGDVTLKLYVNDYTPVTGSVAGSFTEMSTNGYAAKTLAQESWTVSQVSSKASASYAQQTWTFDDTGGENTIYGYFVIDEDAVVLWAERFADPRTVGAVSGDVLRLTPVITLDTEV